MKKCCVVGLGYIGLSTAIILSNSDYLVSGVDIDTKIVERINKGEPHIQEPDLKEFLQIAIKSGNLSACLTPSVADTFIIAVPTPFKIGKKLIPEANLDYLFASIRSIVSVLKENDLVIIESTSPIGTTKLCSKLIYELTGYDERQIKIAYCPERVLPGNIIHEIVHNDRIIGGVTLEASLEAKVLYESFCKGKIHLTNDKTAELTKLAENSFRDVNIAFANELSMVCDKNGINVTELINLSNHHPRVNILNPGTGVGGHCIAIDPWFIASAAPKITPLIQTARKVNLSKTKWVYEKIISSIKEYTNKNNHSPKIGIFGITFKTDSDDIRESPAISIVNKLIEKGFNIKVNEPNLSFYNDFNLYPEEDVLKSDIIIFLVPHTTFKEIQTKDQLVLDFCGALVNKK